MNNIIKKYIGTVQYDEYGGGYIWGINQNGEYQMVAEIPKIKEGGALLSIRGWGDIQNMKDLPCPPEEFQDAIGRFVAEAINEKLERL
jgi:hypothetical protein